VKAANFEAEEWFRQWNCWWGRERKQRVK